VNRKVLVSFIVLVLLWPVEAALASASGPLEAEQAREARSGHSSLEVSKPHHPGPDALSEDEKDYIGIEEKLGAAVPLDAVFTDEGGNQVGLDQLVKQPTVVAFVYYNCRDVCPLLLHGVADVVGKLPSEPLKDYLVLTVSFDETDTPALAAEKKKNFLASLEKPFPADGWRFLTGDAENIRKLTDAVGFRFKRQGDIFLHAISLVVLSPEGKVVRYLYGNTFLPLDLKMALVEASEGRYGPTINRVLRYCFTYDPKGRKYAFNLLRIVGTSMLLMVMVMFIILRAKGKGQGRKEE
jgi:protein SCO1/2